jgi:hypothetical protein
MAERADESQIPSESRPVRGISGSCVNHVGRDVAPAILVSVGFIFGTLGATLAGPRCPDEVMMGGLGHD